MKNRKNVSPKRRKKNKNTSESHAE
jgi:hypothetical protein